jgi:hypothetical protein
LIGPAEFIGVPDRCVGSGRRCALNRAEDNNILVVRKFFFVAVGGREHSMSCEIVRDVINVVLSFTITGRNRLRTPLTTPALLATSPRDVIFHLIDCHAVLIFSVFAANCVTELL